MKRTTINLCHSGVSLPRPRGPGYLRPNMKRLLLAGLASTLLAACRPAAVATVPEPVSDLAPPPRIPLPEIPLVEGPLEPRVMYPSPNQMIGARDSNFIFGSVGNGRASLTINGQPVRVWPNGAFLGYVANPAPTAAPTYTLVTGLGADTVRLTLPVRVPGMPVLDTAPRPLPPPNVITDTTPTWVVLGDSANVASDTDRVIVGRPGPNSTYRWFLMPGTRVQLTGRYPGFARIRLDSSLDIWVTNDDARTFATDTTPPRRVAQNARVRSFPEWVDFIIPIRERPAYFVEERERSIELTLYDTRGSSDVISYPTGDSLVRSIEWAQERTDRARYTLHLSRAPFGYLVLYENGAFVLRVRRPPSGVSGSRSQVAGESSNLQPGTSNVQPATPFAVSGLTIAVDAGHPPGGAIGPTGLTEADAALAVAFKVDSILRGRGANVFMTRTTREPLDLGMRPVLSRRAGAHAFVSIHYNAYGDGVNPFRMPNGTEVYFYRAHSEPLARAVQSNLVAYQPLPDQGIHFRSLAVVRPTWMPAILAEGGFMMVPEQENAMRTAPFQDRYARAIADGLEAYFRSVRRE